MALKMCKECGAEVSSKGVCPKCGKDQRNFFVKHKFVSFLLVIIVIGVVATVSGSGNNNNDTSTATSVVEQNQEKLNLEKFNKIETGMTYKEVVEIIGEEGTVLSESEIGNIKTTIYSWYGEGTIGANANVTFQKGKVTSKAQFGLK